MASTRILVTWDSYRRDDGQWVISAHWLGGESERIAEWSFNLSARTVTAIDETASDLLSDRPIRPVFAEAPVTLTTAPPLAPGIVAFPAMPNAHTGPLPTREQLFDQQRFDGGPRSVPPDGAGDFHRTGWPPVAAQPGLEARPRPRGGRPRARHGAGSLTWISSTWTLEVALIEQATGARTKPSEATARIPQVTNLGISPHRDVPRPPRDRRTNAPPVKRTSRRGTTSCSASAARTTGALARARPPEFLPRTRRPRRKVGRPLSVVRRTVAYRDRSDRSKRPDLAASPAAVDMLPHPQGDRLHGAHRERRHAGAVTGAVDHRPSRGRADPAPPHVGHLRAGRPGAPARPDRGDPVLPSADRNVAGRAGCRERRAGRAVRPYSAAARVVPRPVADRSAALPPDY